MIDRALVLRPEPGNSRTAERLEQAGITARRLPLFATHALAWDVPDPARYDALLITSANAPRFAGAGLDRLRHLPVVAVGAATADAASAAGLFVKVTGTGDAKAAVELARQRGFSRLLHLAGREHIALPGIDVCIVYASDTLPISPDALARSAAETVLLHSARAAAQFAALVDRDRLSRSDWTIAAVSPAVARGAGEGWACVLVAPEPTDTALIAVLCAG